MQQRTIQRLVLFLDGTWNEDEDGRPSTNIVRLREALKIGVDRALAEREPVETGKKAQGSILRGRGGEPNVEYIVYYDRGVGTGALLDRLRGGLSGGGLDQNVRQAYRFLCQHYSPGDEVFVFGFSRGAFTARSLVGFVYAAGLLTAENCTAENEAAAWAHYRMAPNDRYCGTWFELQRFTHPYEELSLTCLGVFDTVGALGIPLTRLRAFNREKYEFHNTELSSIVKYSLHAVAIDEHRRTFQAALWQKPKFKRYNTHVEQVWFPGAHADVGGGNTAWDRGQSGLQDIAFDWMARRVAELTRLHLPTHDGHAPATSFDRKQALAGTIHRPWALLDLVRRPASRWINQIPPLPQPWIKPVGQMRHADPVGEKVHISALELLAKEDGVRQEMRFGRGPYQPANLVAALPSIAATYFRNATPGLREAWEPYIRLKPDGSPVGPPLHVVDWGGHDIPDSPGEPGPTGDDVFDLLPRPDTLDLPRLVPSRSSGHLSGNRPSPGAGRNPLPV